MNKLFLIFFFLFNLFIKAEEFNSILPLKFNFKGIVNNNEAILIYGNNGSIIISENNGKTWQQKKLFDNSLILNCFIISDNFYFIGNDGIIKKFDSSLSILGKTLSIEDSIFSSTLINDNFFIRTKTGIIKINKNLEIEKKLNISDSNIYEMSKYKTTLIPLKNNLVALIDSSYFVRFDNNLEVIDTFHIKKNINAIRFNVSELQNDSSCIYFCIDDVYYQLNEKFDLFKITTKINFYDTLTAHYFRIINNKKIFFNVEYVKENGPYLNMFEYVDSISYNYLGKIDCSVENGITQYLMDINDFTIIDSNLFVIANNKFLVKHNLINHESFRLSDLSKISFSPRYSPDMINDTLSIFYLPFPYSTTDNGATFQPIKNDSIFFSENNTDFEIQSKLFDNENNTLYFLGYHYGYYDSVFVLISNDYGLTYEKKRLLDITYKGTNSYVSDFKINNSGFLLASNYSGKILKSKIVRLNSEFNKIDEYIDSNYVIDYLSNKSDDDYIMLITDSNGINHILYNKENGLKKDTLKSFKKFQDSIYFNNSWYKIIVNELLLFQEITLNNERYLTYFYYDSKKKSLLLEVINLSTYSITNLLDINYEYEILKNFTFSLLSQDDTVYISYDDKVIVITDLFNKSKWKTFELPMKSSKISIYKKFNNFFYSRYSDSNNSNDFYMFNINQLKEITDNIEYQSEIESYFYNYPPNPNPTSNIINITLVWDLTLNKSDISLYDYLGNRLGSNDEVEIEYLSTKRGILKYNCSKLDNGVYFFVIKHGDIIKSIPFIVRK